MRPISREDVYEAVYLGGIVLVLGTLTTRFLALNAIRRHSFVLFLELYGRTVGKPGWTPRWGYWFLWVASFSLSLVASVAVGWLWARRASLKEGTREHDTFVPCEWIDYFEGLSSEDRRAASVRVCRKVFATVSLSGEEVERAMTALADGQLGPDLLPAIRLLVERIESEYDALVGDDEGKLMCVDPLIKDAFVRARAATALLNALEGDQDRMAYEAWFVLADLDEVRRLVGMPAFSEPISPTAEPTSNPLWDRELD